VPSLTIRTRLQLSQGSHEPCIEIEEEICHIIGPYFNT
jgi:hypothetical protein